MTAQPQQSPVVGVEQDTTGRLTVEMVDNIIIRAVGPKKAPLTRADLTRLGDRAAYILGVDAAGAAALFAARVETLIARCFLVCWDPDFRLPPEERRYYAPTLQGIAVLHGRYL